MQVGVRQGGVLSSVLFAVYLDELICKLKSSGLGLYVLGTFMGCIVYADDILLLSNSVSNLQKMVDICADVVNGLGLCFNTLKSVVLRVGN